MTIQSLLTLINPDVVNGFFEFGGAVSIGYNSFRVWKDKSVKGVSLWSTGFFLVWGCWNPFWYGSLSQPYSLTGGIAIVLANVVWLSLMLKFRNGTGTGAPIPTEPAVMDFDTICEMLDNNGTLPTTPMIPIDTKK